MAITVLTVPMWRMPQGAATLQIVPPTREQRRDGTGLFCFSVMRSRRVQGPNMSRVFPATRAHQRGRRNRTSVVFTIISPCNGRGGMIGRFAKYALGE